VLVYDGRARLQEDFAIGASSAIVNSIVNTELLPTGDYYSRGTRKASPGGAQNGVWAVRNGVLFAQTGDPVASPVVGPVEHWASSFLAFTGNTNGDTVLVGKTDNPNAAIDDVVVVNGEVVLREGDPIDLNNNGQYDDNVFIGRGNNTLGAFEVEDVALANDGMLYIFVDLRDGQGNDLGTIPPFGTPQAFVRLDTSPECVGDANDNGVVDIDDLVLVITNWAQATQTINISMQDFEFSPSSVNAHAGDTLQFNWVSGTHTATSGTGCVGDGLFDFPITRGTPTAQYVIPQSFSGNLGFFCTPHCAFGMTGEATVSSFGADVDGNGVVDIDDLVLVITHWGACP
jgi:plastocyanin